MTREELVQKITELKKEKNAIVLAHYYSNPDVQDVADFLGDSLELSRKAGTADADIIVFAGVHFMAETAALISPNKKVLVPALGAGCTLADGVCGQNRTLHKIVYFFAIIFAIDQIGKLPIPTVL